MAELKFPTLEELGKQGGEWALDVFEYKGLTIRQWADKITAGKYQPVKHGEWIKTDVCENQFKCSECGRTVTTNTSIVDPADFEFYCYNCGAKMDGGADE